MKKFAQFLFPLAALVALAVILRTPDTDPERMIQKYTNEHSRFAQNEDGLRVHFRDQGNRNGPVIVLIHGTAASLHTWEPLIERLESDYRLITYTQPGHGLTGPHPEEQYDYDGMADALDVIGEELSLERFTLAGNSMGGWIAWRYALANPEQVDALILLDAAGAPLRAGEKKAPSNIGFKLMQNPVGRIAAQYYTPRALVKKSALQSVSVKAVMDGDAVDRYWELLRYPGNRRAAVLRMNSPEFEKAYADRLDEIKAPTLIIWGEEDRLIHATAAQTFQERIPNSKAVIYKGIGHIPMEEAPDRTASDIDAFLKENLPAN